jgi:hypothetical protein
MLATLLQHLVNSVLLAETLGTADEVDLQPVLGRQALGILAQRLAPGLGPLGIVEDADLMSIEIRRHPFRIT